MYEFARDGREFKGHDHPEHEGRVEAAHPPPPETAKVDTQESEELCGQQRRDEEPGEDEEDRYAQKTARRPSEIQVMKDDERSGDGAQPIKSGDIAKATTRASVRVLRPWTERFRLPLCGVTRRRA